MARGVLLALPSRTMERRPQTRIQALAERAFHGAALASAALVLLLMLAILLELIHSSSLTLGKFGWKFLSSAAWNPVTR